MSSSHLLQGETSLVHNRRSIQVFYKTSPSTKFLALVSTGLGRTNDLSRLPKWLDYLSESQQYGVLLYNYPGRGKTSARHPELTQTEQMVLDLEYLIKLVQVEGWSSDQILIIGISIGTGPTLQFLKNEGPKFRGIMLFSPYMTPMDICGIDDELREFFGYNRDEIGGFDSREAIKEVARQKTPQDITIVVGMEDTTISPEHGTDLYGFLKDTRHTTRLFCIKGASHAAVRTMAKDCVKPILEGPNLVSNETNYPSI